VTTFTTSPGLRTLPIWIFDNVFRPNQAPVVNVAAAALILLSIIPIWASQRLSPNLDTGRAAIRNDR
jgi:putative spermidine/putrescine transport system permease protein